MHRETGEPCTDLLKEQWRPNMSLRDVFTIIRTVLGSPSASSYVNNDAAHELAENLEAFEKHAREETQKYATY